MSTNPTITIFNANPLAVQIQVNNGAQFPVAGATPGTWAPTNPVAGTGPTWSNQQPGQNIMAPGANTLSITPTGALKPYITIVNLPASFVWDSLQLYIYFNTYTDVSWVVLNGGQFVTASLQLSSAAAHSAKKSA